MSAAGKDVMGKIIDFLRERGGEADIGASPKILAGLDCTSSTLGYALKTLSASGVIKKVRDRVPPSRIARHALNEPFEKGDSWREVLKRKSSDNEPEAGPSSTPQPSRRPSRVKVHDDKKCLEVRKALLQEVINAYQKLDAAQKMVIQLQKTNQSLRVEKEELQKKLEVEEQDSLKLVNDVAALETQARGLRIQTSRADNDIRRVDQSGILMLRDEDPPDRS